MRLPLFSKLESVVLETSRKISFKFQYHSRLEDNFTIVYEINHSIFKGILQFSALGLLQEFYNSLKQLGDIHFELLTARKR